MYPVLMSIPDVIGFDLYPLQVWCRPAFGDVMDAQRELHTASGGKPTFQWIEVAPMEHPCKRAHCARSDARDRARRDVALDRRRRRRASATSRTAGRVTIGSEITRTNREIKALTQALLAPVANATLRTQPPYASRPAR